MQRWLCKGKIHRATVTAAEMDYVGSITIDRRLMELANILPYEMVQIASLANGTRWKTYALPDSPGSGTICLNGPPAHFFHPGDLVIILSMGLFSEVEISTLQPVVVFVDGANQVVAVERHLLANELND